LVRRESERVGRWSVINNLFLFLKVAKANR
jgi:hypothetical protein